MPTILTDTVGAASLRGAGEQVSVGSESTEVVADAGEVVSTARGGLLHGGVKAGQSALGNLVTGTSGDEGDKSGGNDSELHFE